MDLQEEEKISTKKYEEPLKRISDSSINTLKKQAEKYKIKSNECLQRFRDDYNSKINCVLTYEEQFKHKHDLQMKQIDNYRIEFDYCLKQNHKTGTDLVDSCITVSENKIYRLRDDILS